MIRFVTPECLHNAFTVILQFQPPAFPIASLRADRLGTTLATAVAVVASHHTTPTQHTRECLAKIGIQEEGKGGQHGQDAILKLIAAIMHLLNVGFMSGMGAPLWPCVTRGLTRLLH